MQTKYVHALIALGVICLPEVSRPREAVVERNPIHRVRLYEEKVLSAPRQLRNSLMVKVMDLPQSEQLSEVCLNQMVDKVYDLKATFYAGFTFACHDPDQYWKESLEAAEPAYLGALLALAGEA
uniref:Aegyptin/gSG7 salivary protein-like four-helix bundle domain-containing protein n=1 Tax=Anopheles dirus TaxID=7168 RepID=A0A182NFE1_9DIPT